MDQSTTISLADAADKETWTVEDHEELIRQLFTVIGATGKFKDILTKMTADNPDPKGSAALKIGIARYTLCRFPGALDVLTEATDNKDRRWFQGLCLVHLRRYGEAIEELGRAKARGMDADKVDLKLAETHALDGDLDAAEKLLTSLSAALKDNAQYHYVRGLIADLAGLAEQAVEAYEQALAIDEDCPEATFRLAYFYDMHGDEDKAIELYHKCTAQPPVHANALLNLAVLHDDAGEYDKAIAAARRVLANNPNHARARLILKDAESSKVMFYDEEQAKRMAYRSAVLDTPVTDFELSVRARNCLKKMNIRTLGDLVRTSEGTLMSYKNFGETSLKEIKEMLTAKNLSLGQALEEGLAEEMTLVAFASRGRSASATVEVKEEVLNMSVTQVDFSIRVQRALETIAVHTLGDLMAKTEADLLACSNFGQTSLNEVHAKLTEHNLKLSEAD